MQLHPDERLRDLRVFTTLIWKHQSLPVPTDNQLDIIHWLQNAPSKRIQLIGFRGIAKSYLVSILVCYELYWNQKLNILVVSAGKARADQFSTFTKRLLKEVPFLQHLYPLKDQRSANDAFDVCGAPASHAPSVRSTGITGQITGARAHIIIADDVESPSNSGTQRAREDLLQRVQEFESVLHPGEGSRIYFLGTPQTEDSVYKELETKKDSKYVVRVWPVRYPELQHLSRYRGKLSPRIQRAVEADPSLAGTTTEPTRFSNEDLIEREVSMGRSNFSLQFMLDTSLSDRDRFPLRLSDLMVMDLPADKGPEGLVWSSADIYRDKDLESVGLSGDYYHRPAQILGNWIPYSGMVMAVDPSGKGSDETAYSIVGSLNGNLFIKDVRGLKTGYEDATMLAIAQAAKTHGVKRIIVEENFGQGMFAKLLQPHLGRIYPCTVEEIRHNKQKELRIIDTLEPLLNQHKLCVDRGLVLRDRLEASQALDTGLETSNLYQLFYQLTRITKERGCLAFDDRLDSLAMACAYWVSAVAQEDKQRIAVDRAEREAKFFRDLHARVQMFNGVAPVATKERGWIKSR